jgi:hypothetical protein
MIGVATHQPLPKIRRASHPERCPSGDASGFAVEVSLSAAECLRRLFAPTSSEASQPRAAERARWSRERRLVAHVGVFKVSLQSVGRCRLDPLPASKTSGTSTTSSTCRLADECGRGKSSCSDSLATWATSPSWPWLLTERELRPAAKPPSATSSPIVCGASSCSPISGAASQRRPVTGEQGPIEVAWPTSGH